MSESVTCLECGAGLPADAPQGLCPRCLVQAAFAGTGRDTPSPPDAIDLLEFRRVVVDLGLVSPEEWDRFAARSPGEVSRVSRALVQARKLTAYQAAAIAQGKARGLLIGRYVVLDRLGAGGMGLVLRARDPRDGKVVALKMLPPSFGRDPDAVRRFRREVQIAARLDHPNVVASLDASEDRGVHFMTMEYVSGHDLDKLVLAGGPLPIKLALHCAIQAGLGLEAAHALGIIHRDIKPGNIMLDRAGGVRVLDLGLARVVEATNLFGQSIAGPLTQTGTYLGTVDFMAPEQADNLSKADHRADIYSLGCTLYFLLAGRPPFLGETALKRLMAHQRRPAPSLQAARPEVPRALEDVYQRMMAKRPEDRPQSMNAVVAALEACRRSRDDASTANADLESFAQTVMKRADRREGRRDSSVFARPEVAAGLDLDPDRILHDDVVAGYRKEEPLEELPEEKLPPRPSRANPPRRRRRTDSHPLLWGTLILLALAVGYLLYSRPDTDRSRAHKEPKPVTASPSILESRKPEAPDGGEDRAPFLSMFNGRDLAGWSVLKGDPALWSVEGGMIVARGMGDHRRMGYLVSDRDHSDFVLRFQFQAPEGADSGLAFRVFPGETDTPLDWSIRTFHETPSRMACLYWSTNGRPEFALMPGRPAELRPPGTWNDMEAECAGDRFRGSVNGREVLRADLGELARRPNAKPSLGRRSGRVGFQAHTGTVRFRNIEIRELSGESPPPTPTLAARPAAGGRTGRVVFVDEFNDPGSGWANQPAQKWATDAAEHHGYADGLYRLEARAKAWYLWTCPAKPPTEFSCEFLARAYSDPDGGRGTFFVHIDSGIRGVQIGVDNAGRFQILTMDGNDQAKYGPTSHPAIKVGRDEFNRVVLHVSKGRFDVSINGERICDPVPLPWDTAPTELKLGVSSNEGTLRAEYDRFEMRELDPGVVR